MGAELAQFAGLSFLSFTVKTREFGELDELFGIFDLEHPFLILVVL